MPVETEDFDMAKTIIIAVCSAAAYLALVIGVIAFCSYRLLSRCGAHKTLPPCKKEFSLLMFLVTTNEVCVVPKIRVCQLICVCECVFWCLAFLTYSLEKLLKDFDETW